MSRNRTGHGSEIDHAARKAAAKRITKEGRVYIKGFLVRSVYEVRRLRAKFDAALDKHPLPRTIAG